MLTRTQMERIITEGGSVLHQGKVITRTEELPSDAELAEGNPDQEAVVAAGLQARIAEMEAQLVRLSKTEAKGKK